MTNNTDLYNQFNMFPSTFLERYFQNRVEVSNNKDIFERAVLDYFRPTLIYLINEKRENGALEGDTSEERYNYFNDTLCSTGIILEEIETRFPEICARVVICIEKYLKLHMEVFKLFIQDFKYLKSTRMIDLPDVLPDASLISIKITGDIHNGGGVCIIDYNSQKVVFKRKSVKPNQFIQSIDQLASLYFATDIQFTPKFLDMKDYFWEEFIPTLELKSQEDAKLFYKRMGYLLCYSYIFNITDLHFENLLAAGSFPKLVDIETLFSVPPLTTVGGNKATKKIIDRSRNSVIATGILPMSEAEKIFGGDMSGILGGTLVNEVKVLINKNRDDICFEKRKQKVVYQEHLPYFIRENGSKYFLDASNYVSEITEGFFEMGNFFINNKDEILNICHSYSDMKSRILFRNTRDYGLITQLLLSPIYSKQSKLLFEKMANKLCLYESKLLCESEAWQLGKMDIPIFFAKVESNEVWDDRTCIWKLPKSALDSVVEKIKKLNKEGLYEQINLIEFSIKASEEAYSTILQDKYREFSDFNRDISSITDGLNTLVDKVIIDEECDDRDSSINWMTLKVSDFNNLELVPMDFSVYDGIAGVALALCEVFDLVTHDRQGKIFTSLEKLFLTLVNGYNSVSNNSFYIGRLGIYSALQHISKITNQLVPDNILNDVKKIPSTELLNADTDFLSGLPGILLSLSSVISPQICQKILLFLEENQNKSDSYVFWGDSKNNNVSLAHGNAGIELSLLILSGKLKSKRAYEIFLKAKTFDDKQKIESGWIDNRNRDTSANWCHGSTGVLISRIEQLRINNDFHILSVDDESRILTDITHAVNQILQIGFDMTNFTLCHGTSGNLLALSYYYEILGRESCPELADIIRNEFCKMLSFGISNGWMCSFNSKYNSYGLMTGISGIIFATAKYLKSDSSLEVLLPII